MCSLGEPLDLAQVQDRLQSELRIEMEKKLMQDLRDTVKNGTIYADGFAFQLVLPTYFLPVTLKGLQVPSNNLRSHAPARPAPPAFSRGRASRHSGPAPPAAAPPTAPVSLPGVSRSALLLLPDPEADHGAAVTVRHVSSLFSGCVSSKDIRITQACSSDARQGTRRVSGLAA